MTRYLVYTSPARGHVYPLVPTLLELRDRGHEVTVRTLASEVELLRGLGFDAAPIATEIEERTLDDWKAKSPPKALDIAISNFVARARLEGRDLRAAIDAESPDALLVDVNTWGALATAETWGGPWAMFAPYLLPISSNDTPPWGPGLKPASGLLARPRDAVLRRIVEGGYDKHLDGLNDVRAKLGARSLARVTDVFAQAPRTIYYTAEPFEYHHSDWPQAIRFVGPGLWEPRTEQAPEWLDSVERPLVLVTASTEFQDDGKLIQATLDGLAGEDVEVVATTAALDPSRFAAPSNARVERFVPHGPVVERAACVVCHGGMGITQKALAAGVPVVAVPFGRDQHETARRVEVAGAGTRLTARRLNPRRLRAAVESAMRCRDGARRIADAFAQAGGASAAADELEAIVPKGVAA
jgi:MGT family glycosyltransferase